MTGRLATFAAVATILGCATDRPAPDPQPQEVALTPAADVVLDMQPCEDVDDWWTCARAREHDVIRRVDGVARRGDTLAIAVPGRTDVRLADVGDADDGGHSYLYMGTSAALDAHLVAVLLYEGRGFLIVSRTTGRTTDLDAMPVASPDGSRVVTASRDTEAGYDPNRVRILRVERDSLVLEWELEPESWGPDDPRWIDGSTIHVQRRPSIWHPDTLSLRAPLVIRRGAGGWVADTVGG